MYSIVIATRDTDLADRLASVIQREAALVRIDPDGASLREVLPRIAFDLALLDMSIVCGFGDGFSDAVRVLRDIRPGLRFLAIGNDGHAAEVLTSVRAGAVDFLDQHATASEIVACLQRALGRVDHREARREGELYPVLCGRAGGGESLFALNLAVILARRNTGGNGVLLLDCTLPSSIAGVALGLEPNYTVHEAVNDLPRMDRTLLTSTMARHAGSGLYILPLSFETAPVQDVSASSVSSLLFVLRGLLDAIVVDVGKFRGNGMSVQLIRSATTSFLYTTQKLTDVQSGHWLLKHSGMSKVDRDLLTLVIGDYHKDIELSDKQISETLGIRTAFTLPSEQTALINSLNAGSPLALTHPRASYVRAISHLLEMSQGRNATAVESKKRGGLIHWLLPRIQ